ncbi:hypothetical protein [Nocardia sp. NPDC019255]|uniref:hypothetical protein n=1 Tax=Nocardia sp. NPDC019255 TaxID=3154591 RepID=UPI0033D79EF6
MSLHLPRIFRRRESELEITQPLNIHTCFEHVSPQRAPFQRPVYPPGWDWMTPEEWEADQHHNKGETHA